MNEGPGMVLVVGGTGMLRPMVHELVSSGATVLVVARRPSQGAPVKPSTGRFIPVTADWARPEQLADAILMASGGRQVTTAVLWIHSPYRSSVLQELKRAIAEMATVIQVRGSAGPDVAEKWDRSAIF